MGLSHHLPPQSVLVNMAAYHTGMPTRKKSHDFLTFFLLFEFLNRHYLLSTPSVLRATLGQ